MSWYEHREHLPWFMKNLAIDKPYVEVGVWKGEHLDHVKHVWGGECIGVDPYEPQDDYPDSANHASPSEMAQMYLDVSKRHRVIRKTSVEAAHDFEDESLGCVYLDGNHTYRAVMQDLHAWWDKLAVGGVMAGHDYQNGLIGDHKQSWFGVAQAVDDFAREMRLARFVTSDRQDWYFIKEPYHDRSEILLISNFYGDWPQCIISNHRLYAEVCGYDYVPYGCEPPPHRDPQWSKMVAIQTAIRDYSDKKFIWWVDADIVFMNPVPLHPWCFQRFHLVGGAYKVSGFWEGLLNTCWFGFQNQPFMHDVIRRAMEDHDYWRRYPHEEAGITRVIAPRANDNVILEDIHHPCPATYWGHYSTDSWMLHVIGMHGPIRHSILRDCCAMSRL